MHSMTLVLRKLAPREPSERDRVHADPSPRGEVDASAADRLDVGLARLRDAARNAPTNLEALADHLIEHLLPESGPVDDVALLLVRATGRDQAATRPTAEPPAERGVRAWFAARRARGARG